MIKHERVVLRCCVCVSGIAGVHLAQRDVAGHINSPVKRHKQLLCEVPMGRDYAHVPRPVLGPTQPPVQRYDSLSRGVKRPKRVVDNQPHLVPSLKKE